MPRGLQVFDATGVTILDTNSVVGRFLGEYHSPSYSGNTNRTGTIELVGVGSATPFYYSGLHITGGPRGELPRFQVVRSGNSLVWSLNPWGWTASFSVFYGIL